MVGREVLCLTLLTSFRNMSFYCWFWLIQFRDRTLSFYWKAYCHIRVTANNIWTTRFPLRKIIKQRNFQIRWSSHLYNLKLISLSLKFLFQQQVETPSWFALRSQSLTTFFYIFSKLYLLAEKSLVTICDRFPCQRYSLPRQNLPWFERY